MTGLAATTAFMGISLILALSCYIVLKAGEISFGQQAFFGIGAYAGGILTAVFDWPLSAALAAAAFAGAIVGLLTGIPLSRLSGFRFTLTTLVLAEFVREALSRITFVRQTGGREVGPDGPLGFSGIEYFYDNRISPGQQAVIVVAAAIFCTLAVAGYMRTGGGRKLLAVAADDKLSASLGIDPLRARRHAFALAGALAAFGGALFAHHATYVDASNFGIMMGVHAVAYVLIGGVTNVLGPVIGTAVDVVLLEWLRIFGPFRMVAFGLLLVLILIVRPGGILGTRKTVR